MSCDFTFCKGHQARLQEVDTPIEAPSDYRQIDSASIPQCVYRPANATLYGIRHLNCMHEREYYQTSLRPQQINAQFLQQLFLVCYQLNFASYTKALTLSLFVRCFPLLRPDATSVYYLLAVIHLAAKYAYGNYPLYCIIYKGLGQKAQHIVPARIIDVEDEILDYTAFDFSYLTVFDFVDAYAAFAQLDERHLHLIRYMCFQLMADGRSYQYKPSNLAAACISQSMKSQNQVEWNQTLQFWSGKSVSDFATETDFLHELIGRVNTEGHVSGGNIIYKLYSNKFYQNVTSIKIE